jgi:hypothetical protein
MASGIDKRRRRLSAFSPYNAAKRLYNLKLQHVALILILGSLGLYWTEELLSEHMAPESFWLRVPIHSVADGLLTIAVVAFTFEYLLRQEAEVRLTEIASQVVGDEHRKLVPELAQTLATRPETLLTALHPDRVENVLSAALAISLRDRHFASEVHNGLLRTINDYPERWIDTRHKLTLTQVDESQPENIRARYFQGYLTLRFQTTLRRQEFHFECVRSKQAYDDVIWNRPDAFYTWLLPPTKEFPTASPESFDVTEVRVDSIRLEAKRQAHDEGRSMLFTFSSPSLATLQGRTVTVQVNCQLKIEKRAHVINLGVPSPTRGMLAEIDYRDTEIAHVDVFDSFVSRQRPDIRLLPTPRQPRRIEVELDEWVFPKGGVVFTWELYQERDPSFLDLLGQQGFVNYHAESSPQDDEDR